jgi:hypothetical protein
VPYSNAEETADEYGTGYTPSTVMTKGKGYWLKFDGEGPVGSSTGEPDSCVTVSVQDKWNLIGGPSGFVSVGAISATGTTITSSFYGYGTSGYYTATTIEPGHGYWVKVSGAGTLDLCMSGAAAPKTAEMPAEFQTAGKVTLRDATGRSASLYIGGASSGRDPGFFELPPAPPAGVFDIRFGSGRMLEALPSAEAGQDAGYPILIQGVSYPITVSWDLAAVPGGGANLSLTTGGERSASTPIAGSGSVVFRDARSAAGLSITASGSPRGVPAEFALGRNFPNPFNPSTSMQVDIPSASEVDVAVYDLLGRLVSRLMSGPQPAGSVTITWDGRDNAGMQVPTGMYIVRMTAGGFSASQKVLMMK